jgi:hypothetical protein
MKNLKSILIALILTPTLVASQAVSQAGLMGTNDQTFINPSNGMANIGGNNVTTDRNLYEGVKGSPMLFKEFVKGFVIVKDTVNTLEKYTYNFDAFKQELHIRYPNGKVKVPYIHQINGFQLIEKDIAHNFKKAKVAGESDSKFYEIIAETPQYSLVKLWIRNFVRANPVEHGLYQSGQRYDEFQEGEKYFLKHKESGYKELKKLSKNDFIDVLPSQKKAIETYWAANKLGKKITEIEASKLLKALVIE